MIGEAAAIRLIKAEAAVRFAELHGSFQRFSRRPRAPQSYQIAADMHISQAEYETRMAKAEARLATANRESSE